MNEGVLRRRRRLGWLLPGVLFLVFGALVVRNSWLSDDAYITFRTVDNFVHGYGLTWNVFERVQVYTHPLWMFLVSGVYALTGEITITSQLLSIVVSMAAAGLLLFGVSRSALLSAVVAVVFCLSKATVDYATSGLENPLTHLILALFLLTYVRPRLGGSWIFWLSFWAALGMTNRMDTAVLFGPALAWALLSRLTWRSVGQAALGMAPLLAWEAFSLVYYGALVPNTAPAKLNTGLIDAATLTAHGWTYLYNSLRVDPITLVALASGGLAAVAARRWRRLPLVGGIVLYLLYIVRVGGDFMSGRFLSAPLFLAMGVLLASGWPGEDRQHRWAVFALGGTLLALGLSAPYTPLRAPGNVRADANPEIWVAGRTITDERANYYTNTGLLRALRAEEPFPDHDWAILGRRARSKGAHVVVKGSVGFYGFYAGPDVVIVDLLALGDPLLARLPVMAPDWKIGHYGRYVPEGYLDTLETGVNRIEDEALAAYYDRLVRVTQGPFWSPARWRAIWQVNTGAYEGLLNAYVYHKDAAFVPRVVITNPTSRRYVYAYIWNVSPGEIYLLDDASELGATYTVTWDIDTTDVTLEGRYLEQISAMTTLSDTALLNVGAFFSDSAALTAYEMYERRYWFAVDERTHGLQVLLPGPGWYNAAAPGGYWEPADLTSILELSY